MSATATAMQPRVSAIAQMDDVSSFSGITRRAGPLSGRTFGNDYRRLNMGKVLHFRPPALSVGGGDLLTENTPGDVGAQGLASDFLTTNARFAFDWGAIFSRDAVLQPGLNRLMPTVLDIENSRGLNTTAENADRPLGCCLGGGFGFHEHDSTQENLVMLDDLALSGKPSREKLASMSIHSEIKRLREAKGWSHQTLAEEINKHEKREKVMAWQAIQQWENGTTAPTRKRLPHVAAALGVTMQTLQGIEDKPATEGLTTGELRLLSAYRVMSEDGRLTLVNQAMQMVRETNPDVARLMPDTSAPEPAKKKSTRTGLTATRQQSSTFGKAAAAKKRRAS